jgi:Trk K+ transport system NAD-binding subunit
MEVKMPKDMESHIVMCNWHDRGDRIIKELHSPLAAPETDIIVITEKDVNERELRLNPEYEKVFFIESDPTLHDVLKRARAHLATSVILLADDDVPDPDAKTALIALALAKLTKDLPKKPHVIAEVMNHHKIEHLLDAGINEWVCSNDYGLGILAQSALYGKLSEVYQQLLTYSKDTNEIYMVDSKHYPQGFLGKGFTEITALLNADRNPANPAILLGVKRDNSVILNPKEDEFDVLKSGDSLIVIAFDPPDLTYLEK